jgi:type I restriction enzyme, R subunit
MIKSVLDQLKSDRPTLAPHYVWEAYARLEEVRGDRMTDIIDELNQELVV